MSAMSHSVHDFLNALLPEPRDDEILWVTQFECSPERAGNREWVGGPLNGELPNGAVNGYISVGTFRNEPDVRRRKTHQARALAIVLDDIATDALGDLPFPPTWELETSPHNWQVGYALRDGFNLKEVDRVLKAIASKGFKLGPDRSGNNAVRYIRLPGCINNKKRITDQYGAPFVTCLEELHPERRYTLAELATGFAATTSSERRGNGQDRAEGQARSLRESDVSLIADIMAGEAFHDPLIRLAARLIAKGQNAEKVERDLTELVGRAEKTAPAKRLERLRQERGEIPRYVREAVQKYGMEPPPSPRTDSMGRPTDCDNPPQPRARSPHERTSRAREAQPNGGEQTAHHTRDTPVVEEGSQHRTGASGKTQQPPDATEIPRRLIDKAPGILAEYVSWYLASARNAEPVYALASGIAFLTAVVGMRRALHDCWLNTGILTVGPTESGKEFIKRMLIEGITRLIEEAGPESVYIPQIDNYFASGPAVWWAVHDSDGACFLFDTELGRLFAAALQPGTLPYDIIRALLVVHDSVAYEHVLPIRYSSRQTKGVAKMEPVSQPFLAVHGTATPRFYSDARALAGEDGSLNRLLILNCDGNAELRASQVIRPLPESLIQFFRKFSHQRVTLAYAPGVEEYRRDRTAAVRDKARLAPGTWGRYGLKAARVALLAAVCRGAAVVSKDNMTWACDLVEEASAIATRQFEIHGGLADSEADALERAIVAAFDAPSIQQNGGVLTRRLLHAYCRKWRASSHDQREKALRYMERTGLIVPAPKGWMRGT